MGDEVPHSLRVLDLYGCTLGPPGAAAAFRRLETLKMVYCITSMEGLQAMLDASPRLERLWLEAIAFTAAEEEDHGRQRRVLLRCPDATASVTVIHCNRTAALDVDAPSTRSLRFSGFLEHFPFGSAAAPVDQLHHAELSFCKESPPHAVFWEETIGRFRRLRVLKLELLDISDAVVGSGEGGTVFPDLLLLELEVSHEADSHGPAVAIANLLRCCPALQEFHLKCKGRGDSNLNA
ncbi:hypothetical protein HU200_051964 [Digitaria exilis]|uniref:F-box/LRR-repeat protein 15/At3g58940/PEG3-like LRR domain-containing protein n=1 Tax=Digitaria exilis TaxID=1010633 RepID=A0A835AU59_9POAL|nr:hypothetical protein HU200_051964 [Digitaria exilis]